MKTKNSPNLPRIIVEYFEGYEAGPLDEWMKEHGFEQRWNTWSRGNTCALVEGKVIVYKYDVDRFLAGMPNTD